MKKIFGYIFGLLFSYFLLYSIVVSFANENKNDLKLLFSQVDKSIKTIDDIEYNMNYHYYNPANDDVYFKIADCIIKFITKRPLGAWHKINYKFSSKNSDKIYNGVLNMMVLMFFKNH